MRQKVRRRRPSLSGLGWAPSTHSGQALRRWTAGPHSGQAVAEFALAAPVLILLIFGMTLAGFYAFRAAAADWGVFITGAAEGAFESPATDQVRPSVPWGDIRGAIAAGGQYGDRQVSSQIALTNARPWVYGINLVEAQEAMANFRLWRFYAGPPDAGGVE